MVNLERCTQLGGRLDGHLVQGHVDTTSDFAECGDEDGSWLLSFAHEAHPEFVTVPKGSITVNGISLTVVDSSPDGFKRGHHSVHVGTHQPALAGRGSGQLGIRRDWEVRRSLAQSARTDLGRSTKFCPSTPAHLFVRGQFFCGAVLEDAAFK